MIEEVFCTIEKSFHDYIDASYFLSSNIMGLEPEEISQAGIRYIPKTRRWQAYLTTVDKVENE